MKACPFTPVAWAFWPSAEKALACCARALKACALLPSAANACALLASALSVPVTLLADAATRERVVAGADTLTPVTGAQWFARGHVLYAESRYRESVAAFERGLQLRADGAGDGAWNVARGYARLGNRKQAFRWLTHARELGFRDQRATREEPAFDRFRGDPGFKETVAPSSCQGCRMRKEVVLLM